MHSELGGDRDTMPSENGDVDCDLAALFVRTMPAIPAVNLEAMFARGGTGATIQGTESACRPLDIAVPSTSVSPFSYFNRRRVLMTRVAAVLLLGAGILTAWFWFGPGGTNSALAQVQKAVEKAKSATYTVTLTIDDQPSQKYRVMVLGKNLMRTELPDGSISLLDSSQKKVVQLFPKESKAVIIEKVGFPSDFSLLSLLNDVTRYSAREQPGVPDKKFKGRETIGFVVEVDHLKLNVWVDKKTELPVLFESERKQQVPDGAGGVGEQVIKQVWSDFVFGAALDKNLFNLTPPEGYAVERRSFVSGAEADLAEKARKIDLAEKARKIKEHEAKQKKN